VIALLHARYSATDIDHDACAFVAKDRREDAFGIGAGKREFIGVANAGRLDLDQHFTLARPFEFHCRYLKWLSGGDGDGGANVHGDSSLFLFGSIILAMLWRAGGSLVEWI
jgi:hypothetical protein